MTLVLTTKPEAVTDLSDKEARGFAFYVGISEAQAQQAGLSLAEIVAALRERLEELAPGTSKETYAALALANIGTGGRSIDITRLALGEPRATKKLELAKSDDNPAFGVVVDFQRQRVFVDGEAVDLTCREFEILETLTANPGVTYSRDDLANAESDCRDKVSNARTIDVHIRRLRAKLPGYEDIVRTVRGVGYRFDKHPDVLIES
jgi:Response regulators consisting of a CheY-like receiver domain and a winged-helix DNA-binding domain